MEDVFLEKWRLKLELSLREIPIVDKAIIRYVCS